MDLLLRSPAPAYVALIDEDSLDEGDADSRDLDQAFRWVTVYAELLSVALKTQADQQTPADVLRKQVDLYARRLALWKDRCRAIANRYP